MHTNRSAKVTALVYQSLVDLIWEFESINSDIIHCKGILWLMQDHKEYRFNHTELHLINGALKVIAETPVKSPLEKLRQLSARNLLYLLEMNTVEEMTQENTKTEGEFVCLEGIKYGNRFFSTHTPGSDPTKLANGETAYKVLGFANTMLEAQQLIGI